MASLDLALIDASTARLALPTARARGVTISTGEHGYQDLTALLPLPDAQAFWLTQRSGLRAVLSDGAGVVWEGRVEDLRLVNGGVRLAALGDWRSLEDDVYTALWSWSGAERWQAITPDYGAGVANRTPDRYGFDLDRRVRVSLEKNAAYGNLADVATVGFRAPDQGTRSIVGLQCRVRGELPTNWAIEFVTFDAAFAAQSVVATLTLTGAVDRALHLTFTGAPVVAVNFFNNSGALFTNGAESGFYHLTLSDLRVVTSTANRVNTTLTANRAAGVGVTASVGSTAGMYAGMQLVINNGNVPSEIVTVTSVTSPTQFVATFVGSYVIGNAVQGLLVTADEIVRDVRDQANALNAGALSASNRLIAAPGLDILNALYQDDSPQDVLVRLAEQGDAAGRRYEVGVWEGRELFFRPAGSGGRSWAVDAGEMEIEQTVDGLVNSTYGTYEDAGGRTLRTANQTSPQSITRYGRTRRRRVDVDTTSGTLAALVAATATAATATPVPRSAITVRRFATPGGAPAQGYRVRAGDSVTVRNLTPTAGEAVDRVRTFRVAETQYSVDEDAPEITPEVPVPDLDYQVAFTLRQARAGQ